MKQFLRTLPRNLLACFKSRMIVWHATAIVLTAVLVTSGFDWLYFRSTLSLAKTLSDDAGQGRWGVRDGFGVL
jgi:hypothetical protein